MRFSFRAVDGDQGMAVIRCLFHQTQRTAQEELKTETEKASLKHEATRCVMSLASTRTEKKPRKRRGCKRTSLRQKETPDNLGSYRSEDRTYSRRRAPGLTDVSCPRRQRQRNACACAQSQGSKKCLALRKRKETALKKMLYISGWRLCSTWSLAAVILLLLSCTYTSSPDGIRTCESSGTAC